MFWSGISLVVREAVPRIPSIEASHKTVAEVLGEEARASDLVEAFIPLHVSFLRDGQRGNRTSIHEHQIRLRVERGERVGQGIDRR